MGVDDSLGAFRKLSKGSSWEVAEAEEDITGFDDLDWTEVTKGVAVKTGEETVDSNPPTDPRISCWDRRLESKEYDMAEAEGDAEFDRVCGDFSSEPLVEMEIALLEEEIFLPRGGEGDFPPLLPLPPWIPLLPALSPCLLSSPLLPL